MSCFFGHKWSKWKAIKVRDRAGMVFDMQERTCKNCNLTKRRSFV